jgi:hypothetical protein
VHIHDAAGSGRALKVWWAGVIWTAQDLILALVARCKDVALDSYTVTETFEIKQDREVQWHTFVPDALVDGPVPGFSTLRVLQPVGVSH